MPGTSRPYRVVTERSLALADKLIDALAALAAHARRGEIEKPGGGEARLPLTCEGALSKLEAGS